MMNSKLNIPHSPFALPRYHRYKDSGVEWLGKVPEHWDVQSLRAVAGLYVEKNQQDLPVLSVYRECGVILKDSRADNHNATSLDTSNYKLVRPGDLAVNKMKAWQGSLGVSEHHGIVSPAYITCRLNQEKVTCRYIHYLLRSKSLIGALDSISYGVRVGQWDMRFEDFKKVGITIPPKPEQDRIVAFLDQKTSEIDALIAKKQRQIQLLDEQKAILINRAVTRGLSGIASATTGLNPNAKLKPSGIEWIGDIPEHWEVKRGRYLFSESNQRSQDGSEVHLSMSQRFGLVPADSLSEKSLQSESYEGAKLCFTGDLVLNRLKAHLGVFSVAKQDGVISPDYSVFRLLSSENEQLFFELLFKTPDYIGQFNKVVRGIVVGFYRLYTGDFFDVPCLVPPPHEQRKILDSIDIISRKTAELKAVTLAHIDSLKTLRSTLIAHVVTGRIKV